jgi:hypothetical protein
VNALVTLWLTAGRPTGGSEELIRAYETCLEIALQVKYFDVSLEAAAQRECSPDLATITAQILGDEMKAHRRVQVAAISENESRSGRVGHADPD